MDAFQPPNAGREDDLMNLGVATVAALVLLAAQGVTCVVVVGISNGVELPRVWQELCVLLGVAMASLGWRLAWRVLFGNHWTWTLICLALVFALGCTSIAVFLSEWVLSGTMNLLQAFLAIWFWSWATLVGAVLGQLPSVR